MSDSKKLKDLKIKHATLKRLVAEVSARGKSISSYHRITDGDIREGAAIAELTQRAKSDLPLYVVQTDPTKRFPVKGDEGYDQFVANQMIMNRTLH